MGHLFSFQFSCQLPPPCKSICSFLSSSRSLQLFLLPFQGDPPEDLPPSLCGRSGDMESPPQFPSSLPSPLPFLFLWLLGLFFSKAPANVRGSAAPYSLPSPQNKTLSSPASMAPPPAVVQIIVHNQHHNFKELTVSIVLASVAIVAIIASTFCVCIFWRRSREALNAKDIESSDASRRLSVAPILHKFNSLKVSTNKGLLTMIDYASLESATNNFSESNILGEGGFSFVYKACFNEEVSAAVKKLDGGSEDSEREFENELGLLGAIRHPNIISLLGYCVHGETRLLVYELMQNGSLETQLHGTSSGSVLTWHFRMKIALDIARGLEYLHEHCSPPVIHRDLKSSNILLDSDFNAKISDFGLAVTGGNHNKDNLKLSGTVGYVAPEYLLDGKLTEKSDVYAFGVVLLELLMGRKPVEKLAPSQFQSIVTWAMPQLTDRSKLPTIVDPVIRNTMDLKHLYQVAAVAVLCVQREPSYRPLITDVLHSLVPLVPIELGGTLRTADPSSCSSRKSSAH